MTFQSVKSLCAAIGVVGISLTMLTACETTQKVGDNITSSIKELVGTSSRGPIPKAK